MNKKAVFSGFIVLVIGIVLQSVSDQIINSELTHTDPIQIRAFAAGSLIIGGLLVFGGVVLLIYGAILPDPPVHWNNNL